MPKTNSKKNSIFKKALRIVAILWLSSLAYVILCKWMMPPITVTQIVDVFSGYGLKRDYVSWDEMSPNIKLAAIASEDQRFTDHGGFDWKSIDKSMNSKKKKKKLPKGAGASTISQQTAKNVFLWQGHGIFRYIRKVPEFMYTKLIEWVWGKERILEVYLNVIEMGPGIYGVEAASQAYFHKSAKKLSPQEAAMIIACLPNPKKFTVVPLSRRVKWRAPHIVTQMGFLRGDEDIEDLIFNQ
jgi:monofunctional biosynthetic peptidoglycan transglycosylase